jgi:hypothetical protein
LLFPFTVRNLIPAVPSQAFQKRFSIPFQTPFTLLMLFSSIKAAFSVNLISMPLSYQLQL